MGAVPTIKVKADECESGFMVINESDFVEGEHEPFGDVDAPVVPREFDLKAGPTLEEWVKAGYPPDRYPPHGYEPKPFAPELMVSLQAEYDAKQAARKALEADPGVIAVLVQDAQAPVESSTPAPTPEPEKPTSKKSRR